MQKFENLPKNMQKHVNSAGDFKLPDHKHLNSKECQTILQRKVPAHVVKWDHECHQLTSRRSSGSQRMLRYLLKLSSNTFYAELQQEIDVLKQEKKALEESLSTPTINRPNENQNLSRTSIDSELDSHLSICNSDSLTDTEIIRKHVSFQKNAATNYSINDCREYMIFIDLKV
ncbi:unnamed protein product [Chironomus riparius]|uniref:Uncharacterized protein n=1 Tax=Chironomus riparius TaxID=315576 RepID=A0A9N9WN98_9DIPT|nr:unnamed protein product [Chironomus riparius]